MSTPDRPQILAELAEANARLAAQNARASRQDERYDRGSMLPAAMQAAALRALDSAPSLDPALLPPYEAVALPRGRSGLLAGIHGDLSLTPRLLVLAWRDGKLVATSRPPASKPAPCMQATGTHVAPAPLPPIATHAAVAAEIRADRRAARVGRVLLDLRRRVYVAREEGA